MTYQNHFHITFNSSKFHFRPIYPGDKELLQKGFSRLSENSKYLRFFAVHSKLTDYELKFFSEVDGINHIAWGILDETEADRIPVGVGRFVRIKSEPEIAEVAYVVVDSYQGKGLGHYLFAILNIIAARVGLKKFRYFVLSENTKALTMLEYLGVSKMVDVGPIKIVESNVFPDFESISKIPELQNVRTVMKKVGNILKNR
jgi:RimJ/RimL family protein N-acetyltransferase